MKPPTHFIITHEKIEPLHHISIWLGSEEGLTMQKGATLKAVEIPEEFLPHIQKHAESVKGNRELFAKVVYNVEPHQDGKLATDVSYHPKGALFDFQRAPSGVRKVPGLGRHIEDICLGILEKEAGVTHVAPATPPTSARRAQLARMGLPTGDEVHKQIVTIGQWRKKLKR